MEVIQDLVRWHCSSGEMNVNSRAIEQWNNEIVQTSAPMKLSGLMFCLWISLNVFFRKAVTEWKSHVILNMTLENIFTEEKKYIL